MKRNFFRILILCLAAGWLIASPQASWAKFPEKKIRLIAPFAPGGGSDMMARILQKYANPYLGGKLYVVNITGASGAIGWREAAKADPDGYTLAMMVTTMLTAPHVHKNFPSYHLFDAVCVNALDPAMFVVPMGSRFKNIQELIAFAKANPKKLVVATAGVGNVECLYLAGFAKFIGSDFIFVPYKGAGPSLRAVAGGNADFAYCAHSEGRNLISAKKLRPLLVLTPNRWSEYPEIPTVYEIDYKHAMYNWRGLGAPKGLSSEVKGVLAGAFRKAAADPEYQKTLKNLGLLSKFLGPDEALIFLKEMDEFCSKMAKESGLQPK